MKTCSWIGCENSVTYKWCQEHRKAASLARIAAWQADHPARTAAAKKASRARRRETENQRHNARKKTPEGREQVGKDNHLRRARRIGVDSTPFTDMEMLGLYGTVCYLCGNEIDLKAPRKCGAPGWEQSLWRDHVVALAQGGVDTLDNCRPSHAICNLRKGSK